MHIIMKKRLQEINQKKNSKDVNEYIEARVHALHQEYDISILYHLGNMMRFWSFLIFEPDKCP